MQGLLAAIWLLLTLVLNAALAPPSTPATLSIYEAYRLTQEHELDDLIVAAAEDWMLDPFLLRGLLYEESRLVPNIINPRSGASGIAQFTRAGRKGLNTIRRMRGCDDEFTYAMTLEPEEAIPAAAELLSYLSSRWGRDAAVAHYNGGPNKKWFARRVLRWANRFRLESGLPPLPPPRPKRPARLPTS